MKAICKKDFERIVAAQKYLADNPSFEKKVYLDRIDDRELAPNEIKGLGFHEIYGVFFCGALSRYLEQLTGDCCRIVYMSIPSKSIPAKEVSNVIVAGRSAQLFFWWAQGFPRGGIAWSDDLESLKRLFQVMEKSPWCFHEILMV